MFERYTERARRVMALAAQEAQRRKAESIGTEHLLLAIEKEGTGVAASVLMNLGVDLDKIRHEFERLIPAGTRESAGDKLPQSRHLISTIVHAVEEARHLNHKVVGTEHLLLGLLREGESMAATFLRDLGLNPLDVRREVLRVVGALPAAAVAGRAAGAQAGLPVTTRIEGLVLSLIIGVNDWERKNKQEVQADIELEYDGLEAAQGDDISKAVDYSALAEKIRTQAQASSYQLLEALCAKLLDVVMEDPRVLSAAVKLSKPKALSHASNVSVTAGRNRQ